MRCTFAAEIAMEFRILGPLEVGEPGRPLALGGAKQRALLAILLLHANEPVSTDRLIEDLWGERPPADAGKSLQIHVSRLRKTLGAADGIVVTQPNGYLIKLGPNDVDLQRFERLAVEGRRALAGGDPGRANDKLGEALALWRGAPLADFAFEPFAQAEIARLEELRLAAVEDSNEARLALGHHAELVGELETLVRDHPLRERLRGQLMLALYRSGRQAEALAAYRDARRALVDELGLEPGPELRKLERAILAHDPALAAPPRGGPRLASVLAPGGKPRPQARPALRRWKLVAATAAIVGAAFAALVLAVGDSDEPTVPGNSVAVLDPGRNAVVAAIELDPTPGPVAAGTGGVWVLSPGSWTISQIDPRARRLVRSYGIGQTPGNVAAAGEVWVADRCSIGGDAGTLLHAYTAAGGGTELDAEIPLEGAFPRGTPQLAPLEVATRCGLAATGRTAWVATNIPQGIARIDYDRRSVQTRIVSAIRLERAPAAIAVGAGSVWATDNQQDVVRRIDPDSGRTIRTIRVGNDPVAIAAEDDAVWVANRGDSSLSRLDPRTNSVTKAISVGESPVAVAVGESSAWVANSGDGSVTRIDRRTNQVVESIPVGHRPQGVAVAGGAVWVTLRP
jgi:YVTN family beta-propeller protein